MTASDIAEILFTQTERHRYQICNIYLYQWESDVFAITPSDGMAYEFEIKVSRSDFRADFEKQEKHRWLSNHRLPMLLRRGRERSASAKLGARSTFTYLPRVETIPNRFYYVAPAGVIPKDEVPRYAGLIEIMDGKIVYTKRAPTLHTERFTMWQQLLEKYYWQWFNMRKKASK